MPPPSAILLVNPFVYDFTAFDCWAKPLGLIQIGRIFHKLGFRVDLLDCLLKEDPGMAAFAAVMPGIRPSKPRRYGTGSYFQERVEKPAGMRGMPRHFHRFGFHPEHLRARLAALPEPPVLIGVTGIMTYWCRGVRETIAIVKEHFPGVPLVLGGIYPTLCPEHAQATSGADFVFTGPANTERLRRLLTDFGIPLPADRPPASAWRPYAAPAYGVLTLAEGCAKRCTYCASRILRPEIIEHDCGAVLAGLAEAFAQGVRDFAFYDDFLLYRKGERLLPFLREARRRFPGVRFHTPNGMHLALIDAPTARILFEAGFTTLRFGFETASPELAERTGFKVGLADFRQRIDLLRAAGFGGEQIGIYCMAGIPGQTPAEVEESIDFIQSSDVGVHLTEFSPIPGTPEFQRALACSAVDFASDPEFQNNTLLPLRDPAFSTPVLDKLKFCCNRKKSCFLIDNTTMAGWPKSCCPTKQYSAQTMAQIAKKIKKNQVT